MAHFWRHSPPPVPAKVISHKLHSFCKIQLAGTAPLLRLRTPRHFVNSAATIKEPLWGKKNREEKLRQWEEGGKALRKSRHAEDWCPIPNKIILHCTKGNAAKEAQAYAYFEKQKQRGGGRAHANCIIVIITLCRLMMPKWAELNAFSLIFPRRVPSDVWHRQKWD